MGPHIQRGRQVTERVKASTVTNTVCSHDAGSFLEKRYSMLNITVLLALQLYCSP